MYSATNHHMHKQTHTTYILACRLNNTANNLAPADKLAHKLSKVNDIWYQ